MTTTDRNALLKKIAQTEANIADLEARIARGERRPSMSGMHVSKGRFIRNDEIRHSLNWNRVALRQRKAKLDEINATHGE